MYKMPFNTGRGMQIHGGAFVDVGGNVFVNINGNHGEILLGVYSGY